IYVDRIADMRIRDMNTYLDATREMLLHAALQCAGREIPCGLLTGVWIMHFSTITSSFKPYDLPLAVPGTFGIIEKTEQPLQGRFTAEEKEPIYVYCGAGAEPE
ncbi:MAG: hypothetical protein LUD84_05135, partial [Clostridiales bacterium]|nr:hypothetical protein [Clostridiales bacterium]